MYVTFHLLKLIGVAFVSEALLEKLEPMIKPHRTCGRVKYHSHVHGMVKGCSFSKVVR